MSARHWADVLLCDMRADLPEIERAANRRVKELADRIKSEGLHPTAVRAAFDAIQEALDQARKEKGRE